MGTCFKQTIIALCAIVLIVSFVLYIPATETLSGYAVKSINKNIRKSSSYRLPSNVPNGYLKQKQMVSDRIDRVTLPQMSKHAKVLSDISKGTTKIIDFTPSLCDTFKRERSTSEYPFCVDCRTLSEPEDAVIHKKCRTTGDCEPMEEKNSYCRGDVAVGFGCTDYSLYNQLRSWETDCSRQSKKCIVDDGYAVCVDLEYETSAFCEKRGDTVTYSLCSTCPEQEVRDYCTVGDVLVQYQCEGNRMVQSVHFCQDDGLRCTAGIPIQRNCQQD